ELLLGRGVGRVQQGEDAELLGPLPCPGGRLVVVQRGDGPRDHGRGGPTAPAERPAEPAPALLVVGRVLCPISEIREREDLPAPVLGILLGCDRDRVTALSGRIDLVGAFVGPFAVDGFWVGSGGLSGGGRRSFVSEGHRAPPVSIAPRRCRCSSVSGGAVERASSIQRWSFASLSCWRAAVSSLPRRAATATADRARWTGSDGLLDMTGSPWLSEQAPTVSVSYRAVQARPP